MRIETQKKLNDRYGTFERQKPVFGTIIKVKDSLSYDDESSEMIKSIQVRLETDGHPIGEYPILDIGRTFFPEQIVEITPIISRHSSGGSITFFDIEESS